MDTHTAMRHWTEFDGFIVSVFMFDLHSTDFRKLKGLKHINILEKPLNKDSNFIFSI